MRVITFCLLFLTVICPATLLANKTPTPEELKFFETEIRPLLVANCQKCHGAEKQKGKLRLDIRAGIFQGGESGPTVVPFKPDESLLLEAVRWESFEMPPNGKLKGAQIALVEKWIKMGAPWPEDGKSLKTQPKITEEDRQWWAYQPVTEPQIPEVSEAEWCQNEVDRFILSRIEKEGLTHAPAADRRTLIRRVTYDLTGLPPTPEEITVFVNDSDPQAWKKLIDRLLNSPDYSKRYAERQAQQWLDIVRYAESDGFRQDAYRPTAYRYRDYVVRSFENDKPYDQFVREQLAGDEMKSDDPDALIATGFLTHGIYEFNQRDVLTQWSDILNEVTDVTADVFLAQGFSCARCHDHKFDPLLQKDYFRLQAFFTPLFPYQSKPVGTSEQWATYQKKQADWEAKTAEIRKQIAELEKQARKNAMERAVVKFPPDVEAMIRTPDGERTPYAQQVFQLASRQIEVEYGRLKFKDKLKGEKYEQWEKLQAELKKFDSLKPAGFPTAQVARDISSTAPPTRIPGKRDADPIAPGFMTLLDPETAVIPELPDGISSTGRRTALANWITDPKNPLTARVMVNRIWQQHFGRGLVPTTSDFGKLGEPPSHPELLDWLTRLFIESGWSIKAMHQLMLETATYQQQAIRPASPLASRIDPGNRLLWRMPIRRLDAEQIRDALLTVTNELDLKSGGPSVSGTTPRRSLYVKAIRNTPDPVLGAFDQAGGISSTPKRNITTTPTQALLMINGSWTLGRAGKLAARVQKESRSTQEIVDRLFMLLYGRQPSAEEVSLAMEFLNASPTPEPSGNSPFVPFAHGSKQAVRVDGVGSNSPLRLENTEGLPQETFTVEGIVQLKSMYPDASVRTIASWWDNSKNTPGWSLGVTSAKSSYRPRNLIMQFIGNNAAGTQVYEVVPSDIHLELNRPYYVAASVNLKDTSKSGVTFSVKDLSSDAPLQTANVKHAVISMIPRSDFLIGGRDRQSQHRWDGLFSQIRLSNKALPTENLFFNQPALTEHTVANWTFAGTLQEDSGAKRNLKPTTLTSSQAPKNLVDFCHVLLNSNEFLYVD